MNNLLQEPNAQREDWDSHFICLHKIKGLQREKRTDLKLRLQTDLGGDTTKGNCSRLVGQNEHDDSSSHHHNTMASPELASNTPVLLSFVFQLIFYCALEYAAQKRKLICHILCTYFFPSSQVCLISEKHLHYFQKLLTEMGNQHTVIPLRKSYCTQVQLV